MPGNLTANAAINEVAGKSKAYRNARQQLRISSRSAEEPHGFAVAFRRVGGGGVMGKAPEIWPLMPPSKLSRVPAPSEAPDMASPPVVMFQTLPMS